MHPKSLLGAAIVATALFCSAPAARGDTLQLTNGTVLKNCYVRDEGVRITVWKSLSDVGGPLQSYPRSQVKDWKIERDESWDQHPDKPDLTVTFIEIDPKLPGLHGRVQYDKWGRPWIAGDSTALVDVGTDKFAKPEDAVQKLRFQYEVGEQLTFTAHVKNVGFTDAQPFDVEWLIDDKVVKRDRHASVLKEMQECTFAMTWKWQDGFHYVSCRVVSKQPEIAIINNAAIDPLWAFPLVFVVSQGRVDAWHENRNASGTFCFEDFYRWHLDIMNRLLEHSVYPATPKGCRARVRLDRIVYLDQVPQQQADQIVDTLFSADGLRHDQGCWLWRETEHELETGRWEQVDHAWRNQTEWSLPHELGHQLGLVDWYRLDHAGDDFHVWPDNGAKVTHLMRYPMQMMHWHGPQPFGEVDAAYLNITLAGPRGYYGEYYFSLPRHNFLLIHDINGRPVNDALIEIFQRGTVVAPDAKRVGQKIVYFEVLEDGDFDRPVSQRPVIVARTDAQGMIRLPDRPARAVHTLNGFHRRPNPFGSINVVGQRGLMLVRVTRDRRVCYFWLEAHDFLTAWFRGQKRVHVTTLKTPYASLDSPPPPGDVQVQKMDEQHVRLTWSRPANVRERNYLDNIIGYRVYRRIGNDGLNDRPWFPVATLGPEQTELVIELGARADDLHYYHPHTERFGVTSLATSSIESELVETLLR